MQEIENKIVDIFNEIEVTENEKKGLMSIVYIKNEIDGNIKVVGTVKGNRIDLVEVLIMIFKDEEENEFQHIYDAVREYV